MSWTDEDIDRLFSDATDHSSVEFKEEFWNDIEKELPIQRKNNGLYFLGGLVAVLLMMVPAQIKNVHVESFNAQEESNHKGTIITEIEKGENAKTNRSQIASSEFDEVTENHGVKLAITNQRKVESNLIENGTMNASNTFEISNSSISFDQGIAANTERNSNLEKLDLKEFSHDQAEFEHRNYSLEPLKKGHFFVELNAGIAESPMMYTEGGNNFMKTTSIQAGYSFGMGKFGVSVGAGMTNYFMDNVLIKERTKVYGYSSNMVERHYDFNRVMALSIPAKLDYSFGRHHAGINAQFNVPLSCKIEKSQLVDGVVESSSEGYVGAFLFSPIWMQAGISYSYNLSPNWEIGTSFNVQLNEQVQSLRMKGERNSFPVSGTVSLKHILNW